MKIAADKTGRDQESRSGRNLRRMKPGVIKGPGPDGTCGRSWERDRKDTIHGIQC